MELYRKCPPRRVKNAHMTELEKFKCLLSVTTITPIMKLETQKMDATRILLVIDDGVYVCICKVYSYVLKEYKSHAFIYDSHFSQLERSECCGAIIDNRSYAPIYVLYERDRKTQSTLNNMFRFF